MDGGRASGAHAESSSTHAGGPRVGETPLCSIPAEEIEAVHFVVRRDVAASATVLCALCGEAVEGAPCVCDAGLVHMGCTVGEISAARRRMVAEKEAAQVADAAEELRAWRAHELRGRRRDHHRRWEATRARKRRHPPKTSTKPVLVVTTTAMRGCGEGRKRIPGKAKQKTAYEILSGLVGSEMCIRDRL